jgi:hypothetical protein
MYSVGTIVQGEFDFEWFCPWVARRGNGVWGLGSGVWGLGSGVWGLGSGVWGLGSGVWGLGSGVWGLGSGVWGLGSAGRAWVIAGEVAGELHGAITRRRQAWRYEVARQAIGDLVVAPAHRLQQGDGVRSGRL